MSTDKLSPLDEYWLKFLEETGRDEDTRCSGDLNFEDKGFTNDSQVALILAGYKTAFFTSYPTFSIDNEMLPVEGELFLVLDRGNNPRCVIELESVNVIPFNEVTWEMAKREGEDESLSQWREKEEAYLQDEASVVGFNYRPDIRLVYQTFSVVYK